LLCSLLQSIERLRPVDWTADSDAFEERALLARTRMARGRSGFDQFDGALQGLCRAGVSKQRDSKGELGFGIAATGESLKCLEIARRYASVCGFTCSSLLLASVQVLAQRCREPLLTVWALAFASHANHMPTAPRASKRVDGRGGRLHRRATPDKMLP